MMWWPTLPCKLYESRCLHAGEDFTRTTTKHVGHALPMQRRGKAVADVTRIQQVLRPRKYLATVSFLPLT